MKKTLTTLRVIGLLAAAAAVLAGAPAFAQEPTPTIEEKTAGMQAIPGFVPLYWDDAPGSCTPNSGRWRRSSSTRSLSRQGSGAIPWASTAAS